MLRDRWIRAFERRRAARGPHTTAVLPRLSRLGPDWHLRALPASPGDPSIGTPTDHVSIRALAVGPAGLFLLTVVEHGRARILVSGETIRINGRRPDYVDRARRTARRAARELTAAVRTPVLVTPVLVFVGTGVISVNGLPEDCLLCTHRELDRILIAHGTRISPATAAKIDTVAATIIDRIDHPPWPGAR